MLIFKLVCYSVLAPAALGVEPVEASAEGSAGSSPGLVRQLQNWVETIRAHPRNAFGAYFPSQELVEDIKATASLVADRITEFAAHYDVCQPILRELVKRVIILYSGPYATTDYTRRYQDLSFLKALGSAYLGSLLNAIRIAEVWRGASSRLSGALTRFLKDSIEALRMSHEMRTYHYDILPFGPAVFLDSREGPVGLVGAAAPHTAEKGENFKRTICSDYERLAKGVADLFARMIEELGGLLEGVEGTHRASLYGYFKGRLELSFHWLLHDDPERLESRAIEFKSILRKGPPEVLALAQMRVFQKILELKLKFPEMDHTNSHTSNLFMYSQYVVGAINNGPPLIGDEMLGRLEHSSGEWALLREFKDAVESLGRWVYQLYGRLQPDSTCPVMHEQARKWLSQAEGNLSLVLEVVGRNDGKWGLYALASSFPHLDSIVLNIEGMLGILYAPEQVGRGKGEPGDLLIRLQQVIEGVLSPERASGMDGARGVLESLRIGDPDTGAWMPFVYEAGSDRRTIEAFERFCRSAGPEIVTRIWQLAAGVDEAPGGETDRRQPITVETCESPSACSLAGFTVDRERRVLWMAPVRSQKELRSRFGDRELRDAMEYQQFRRALDEERSRDKWLVKMSDQNEIVSVISWSGEDSESPGGPKVLAEKDGQFYKGDHSFFAGALTRIARLFQRHSVYGYPSLSLPADGIIGTEHGYLRALENAGSLWALAVQRSIHIPFSLSEALYEAICGEAPQVDRDNPQVAGWPGAFAKGAHRIIPARVFKRVGKASLQSVLQPSIWSMRIFGAIFSLRSKGGQEDTWGLLQKVLDSLDGPQLAAITWQLWGRPALTAEDYYETWDSSVEINFGEQVIIGRHQLVVPEVYSAILLSLELDSAVKPAIPIRLSAGLMDAGREEHAVVVRVGGVFGTLYKLYREVGARRFTQLKLTVLVVDWDDEEVVELKSAMDYGFVALGEAEMAGLLYSGLRAPGERGYRLSETHSDEQLDQLEFLGFLAAYLVIAHETVLPMGFSGLGLMEWLHTSNVEFPSANEEAFFRGLGQVASKEAIRAVSFGEWRDMISARPEGFVRLMGCSNYECFLQLARLVSRPASGEELRFSEWEEYVEYIEQNFERFVIEEPGNGERELLSDTFMALLDPEVGLFAPDNRGYRLITGGVPDETSHRRKLRTLGWILGKMFKWSVPGGCVLEGAVADRIWGDRRRLVGRAIEDPTEARLDELAAGVFDVVPASAFGVLTQDEVGRLLGQSPVTNFTVSGSGTDKEIRVLLLLFFESFDSFPPHFCLRFWRWALGTLQVRDLSGPEEIAVKLQIDGAGEPLRVQKGSARIDIPVLGSVQEYRVALAEALLQQGFGGSKERFFRLARMSMEERIEIWYRTRGRRNVETLGIVVERENVLDGTWRAFEEKRKVFAKSEWKIAFTSGGQPELGADAGGPFREWMGLVAEQLFDAGSGLFELSDHGSYQIVQKTLLLSIKGDIQEMYRFAGLIVGELLYSGLALGAQLSPILCELLALGSFEGFDFLRALGRIDREKCVLLGSIDVENDEYYFEDGERELVEGGSNVQVTIANVESYRQLMARLFLLGREPDMVQAFIEGVWERVGGEETLRSHAFTGAEIQARLRGQITIDIGQWKVQTEYECVGSVSEERAVQVIEWFWEVVERFSQEQLQQLLKFVSGMREMPLRGFQDTPEGHFKLCITSGEDPNRHPSASTCFNRLYLSAYGSRDAVKSMLENAMVATDVGFGLI